MRTPGMNAGPKILILAMSLLFVALPVFADEPPPQQPATSRPPLERDPSRIPDKQLDSERRNNDEDELDGRFAFDYLKKLAGTWSGALPGGTERRAGSFLTGAAGRVLIGTLLPGTPEEMVSIFSLEGDDLTVTLYDPDGTQPRLRFDPRKSYPGRYFFKFSGGVGFDRTKDRHIHEGSIQFHNSDQITFEWVSYDGLARGGTRTVNLRREGEAPASGRSF